MGRFFLSIGELSITSKDGVVTVDTLKHVDLVVDGEPVINVHEAESFTLPAAGRTVEVRPARRALPKRRKR